MGGIGLLILAGMLIAGMSGKADAIQQFDAAGQLWVTRLIVYLLVLAFWYFIAPRRIVPSRHGEGDDQAEVERKRADVRAITWKVALAIVGFEIVVVQQLGMS